MLYAQGCQVFHFAAVAVSPDCIWLGLHLSFYVAQMSNLSTQCHVPRYAERRSCMVCVCVCAARIEVGGFPVPGSRFQVAHFVVAGSALCGTPMLHVQINFNELSLVANELQNSKTHRDVFSAQRASCLVLRASCLLPRACCMRNNLDIRQELNF